MLSSEEANSSSRQSSSTGHPSPGPAAPRLSQAGQVARALGAACPLPSILLTLATYYVPGTDLSAGDLGNI